MISNIQNNSSYAYSLQLGVPQTAKALKYDLAPSVIDQYNEQVQQKVNSLKSNLETIQKNAADAEKSLSDLNNAKTINISTINSFRSKLQHYSQLALQAGGGNFNQIQDYNSAIEYINNYGSMLANSNTTFNVYLSILQETQPSTDLIFAQVNSEIETFKNTLNSKNIISDFTQSLTSVKQLIDNVESHKTDFSSLTNTALLLMQATQARIQKVLENQSKHQYYFCNKNYNEYQEELDHLNANVDLLNNYISTHVMVETCLTSISKQLTHIKYELLELEELNSKRIIQKFASSNPNELKNQFFNNTLYTNHILESNLY